MTIQTLRAGHLLVVPRNEVDHWDDMSTAEAAHAMTVVQHIAKALKTAFPATRVGMLIAGLEVPHAHIHLVPIDTMQNFDLSKAKMADAETLAAAAEKFTRPCWDTAINRPISTSTHRCKEKRCARQETR